MSDLTTAEQMLERRSAPEVELVAFIPLSNWLLGFERYGMRYTKARIAGSRHPDAFYLHRRDEDVSPGLRKTHSLVERLGVAGDRVVALLARLPEGEDGVRPNDVTGTGVGWRWPRPEIPLTAVGWVDERGVIGLVPHEEITAAAFQLASARWPSWSACQPRSLSVLPIANACQARCAFCFSKASVSALDRARTRDWTDALAWADRARARGAERAVVTGGGEPTLLDDHALRSLVTGLRARFEKIVLITNGARLDEERVGALAAAGLSTLAVSRHGRTPAEDARVMGLAVDSATLAQLARRAGMRTRAVCVLSRDAVGDALGVAAYVERAVRDGFDEVCFKELYVSSLSENPWATSAVNRYAEAQRAPLSIVLDAMRSLGLAESDALPWGSPVFSGEVVGRAVRVAAYTEPSVGWERTHGVVRSWNVMADGRCLASLEDPASVVSADGP